MSEAGSSPCKPPRTAHLNSASGWGGHHRGQSGLRNPTPLGPRGAKGARFGISKGQTGLSPVMATLQNAPSTPACHRQSDGTAAAPRAVFFFFFLIIFFVIYLSKQAEPPACLRGNPPPPWFSSGAFASLKDSPSADPDPRPTTRCCVGTEGAVQSLPLTGLQMGLYLRSRRVKLQKERPQKLEEGPAKRCTQPEVK